MRRQPRVFAWKNAPLVRHKLLEQGDVLVVQGIERKVDFRLWTGCADFDGASLAAGAASGRFFGMCFSWHGKLFDFAMHRTAAQGGVILFDLQFFGLELFVARGRVAGGRLAFLARLGAFDGDNLAGHFIPFP